MKKNLKRTLAKVMAVALTVSLLGTAVDADAAKKKSKKIKLSKKSITITKGKSKKVAIKNVKKKQVKKLTVKSSKKKVATVKKSGKTAIKVTGKKKGSAKITVKVTVKGKKKATKLTLKVKVKNAKKTTTTTPSTAPTQAPTAPASNAPATDAPASNAPATDAPTDAPSAGPQVYGESDPYKITISDENESATTSITKRLANGMTEEDANAYNTNTVYNTDGSVSFTSASQWDGGVQYYIDPDYTTTEEDGKTIYNVNSVDLTKYKGVKFVVKDAYVETSMKVVTDANNYADASGTHKLEKYEGTGKLTDENGDPVGDREIIYSFAGLAEKDLKEAYSIGLAWHNQVGAEGTIVSIELINEGVPDEPKKPLEPAKDEITVADTDQVYKFDKDNEVSVKNAEFGGYSNFIAIPGDIEVKSTDSVYVKVRALNEAGEEVVAELQTGVSSNKNDTWNSRVYISGEDPAKANNYKWTRTGAYQGLFKAKADDVKDAAAKAFAEDTTGKEKVKLTNIGFQSVGTFGDDENLKIVLDEIVVRPGKGPQGGGEDAAEYEVNITAETSSIELGETTSVEVAVVDKNGVETDAIENVTWSATKVEVETPSADKTKVTVTGVETGSAEVVASVKTKDGKTTEVKVKIFVREVGAPAPTPGEGDEDPEPVVLESVIKVFNEPLTVTVGGTQYQSAGVVDITEYLPEGLDISNYRAINIKANVKDASSGEAVVGFGKVQIGITKDDSDWNANKIGSEVQNFNSSTADVAAGKDIAIPAGAETPEKLFVFFQNASNENSAGYTIEFTEFTLVIDGDDIVQEFDEPVEVTVGGTQYQSAGVVDITEYLPEGFDISKYSAVNVKATVKDASSGEAVVGFGKVQIGITKDDSDWNANKIGSEVQNFNSSTADVAAGKKIAIPDGTETPEKLFVFFQNASNENSAGYTIEFTEFTFICKTKTITPAADAE